MVPEFIQSEFGLGRLVDEIVRLLTDEAARQEMLGKFAALPEQLGEPGSVDRAAEMILSSGSSAGVVDAHYCPGLREKLSPAEGCPQC